MGLSELWAPLFLLLVYPTGRVSLEPRIPERSLRAQLLLGDHPLLTHARVCARAHTHTHTHTPGLQAPCRSSGSVCEEGPPLPGHRSILSPWLKVRHPHQGLRPDLLFYSLDLSLHDLAHL